MFINVMFSDKHHILFAILDFEANFHVSKVFATVFGDFQKHKMQDQKL
jgi:hypothetical protein